MSTPAVAPDVEPTSQDPATRQLFVYSTSAITESTVESLPQAERGRIDKFRDVVVRILHEHKCYDLIPLSGKVVVFDSHLSLKHAFRALVEHDIKCAPVWSEDDSDFVGLMTVTDFANILVASISENSDSEAARADWERKANELESRTVGTWALFRKQHGTSPTRARFISVVADNTVYEAVALLHKNFIHRMPVRCIENGKSIVCIVNYQKILRFILQKIDHERESIDMRVAELGLKFDHEIPTISQSSSLLTALKILSNNRRLTAVPIVSEDGVLEDAFLRSDVRFLAVNHAYKRHDISVREFLNTHSKSRFVCRCKMEDSVIEVVYQMLRKRNHISVILDDNGVAIGMLTLRDIMTLILGDAENPSSNSNENTEEDKHEEEANSQLKKDENHNLVKEISAAKLVSLLRNDEISHEYLVIDARDENEFHGSQRVRGAFRYNLTDDIDSLIQNDIVSRSKNVVFCCSMGVGEEETNCAKRYANVRRERDLSQQNVFLLREGFARFAELYGEAIV